MADRANQFVLAAFTSTFLSRSWYSAPCTPQIDDGTAFVPVIAIHVAVLLGILDVAVLVFFIHRIASSVQITALQKQGRPILRPPSPTCSDARARTMETA